MIAIKSDKITSNIIELLETAFKTNADIGNFSPQTIPVGFMEFGFEFIPKN